MHSRHAQRRFEGPPFGEPFVSGRGGPGRGRFGPQRGGGFGGPRGGGYGGGRGRRRRGEIRTALLLLLAEEPRNGYQLMQAIEERSGGRWRPSPGSIYPTLAQLEDEGLIKVTDQEVGKLFELTDQGQEHIKEQQKQTPPWEDSDEPEATGDLRAQIKQLQVAVMQVGYAGRNEQIARAARALAEARRAIYAILAEEGEDSSS